MLGGIGNSSMAERRRAKLKPIVTEQLAEKNQQNIGNNS